MFIDNGKATAVLDGISTTKTEQNANFCSALAKLDMGLNATGKLVATQPDNDLYNLNNQFKNPKAIDYVVRRSDDGKSVTVEVTSDFSN